MGSRGNVLCVCPPKTLDFDDRSGIHRADHLEVLHNQLEALPFGGRQKHYCYLPGGGLVVDAGVDLSAFETCMAAVVGKLDNQAYIAKKYFSEELEEMGFPPNPPLALIKQIQPFPTSMLVCKLYLKFGTRFLHKLRGHWSFVMYDSTSMRVFAARDASGRLPMVLARGADGSLLVASGDCLPDGAGDVQELLPGFYKYGWHCEPLRFAAAPEPSSRVLRSGSNSGGASPKAVAVAGVEGVGVESVKAEEVAAAALLHACLTPDGRLATVEEAVAEEGEDGAARSSKKGRTRRGTRGGRNKRKGTGPGSPPDTPNTDASFGSPLLDEMDWRSQRRAAPQGARECQAGSPAAAAARPSTLSPCAKPFAPTASAGAAAAPEPATRVAGFALPPVSVPAEAGVGAKGEEEEPRQPVAAARGQPVEATQLQGLAAAAAEGVRPLQGVESLPDPLARCFVPGQYDEGSLRMLNNLLFNSLCALTITDVSQDDDPLVYVNHLFELQTGYSADEVLGSNCRFLQAPPGQPAPPSYSRMSLRKALQGGVKRTVRILNYRKDGTPLWNNLSIVPLRSSSGSVTHFIGMQTFSVAEELLEEASNGGVAAACEGGEGGAKRTRGGALMRTSRSCGDLTGAVAGLSVAQAHAMGAAR